MPQTSRVLTIDAVSRYVAERCFGTEGDGRVGLELEWLTFSRGQPAGRVDLGILERAVAGAGSLPAGGCVSFEPGGQLELSTLPQPDPHAAVAAASTDMAVLTPALEAHGVDLVALGLDPHRSPVRIVDTPRYRAMEAYFDSGGIEGRTMMGATASLQVNLDMGALDRLPHRWRAAHAIGPVLVGAFANSPVKAGRRAGWKSGRLANWWSIDGSRTAPPGVLDAPITGFVAYTLAANVMLIRHGGDFVPMTAAMPFARWAAEGHELGWPDEDDLAYHLTTLFPPVRPRGWLELRALDAVPSPYWEVASLVATALLDDAVIDDVLRATAGVANRWLGAARHGLADPDLARAADACFGLAQALARDGRIDDYVERFVHRRRCPADDLLDVFDGEAAAWR